MTAESKIRRERAHWPKPQQVREYVEIARELGIDVRAIEVSRDGSIRVAEVPQPDSAPKTDFDRFQDQL